MPCRSITWQLERWPTAVHTKEESVFWCTRMPILDVARCNGMAFAQLVLQ